MNKNVDCYYRKLYLDKNEVGIKAEIRTVDSMRNYYEQQLEKVVDLPKKELYYYGIEETDKSRLELEQYLISLNNQE